MSERMNLVHIGWNVLKAGRIPFKLTAVLLNGRRVRRQAVGQFSRSLEEQGLPREAVRMLSDRYADMVPLRVMDYIKLTGRFDKSRSRGSSVAIEKGVRT
ncbi:hypothetical protein DNH61_05830 [Paenibacillus sambharensis]|uniref:Uncharacterized protein n=1 Tax=Paenibacillus sambharensis TaxID=1803190 RepID=A0A2W1LC41_9BACL|nr:hypothetical protein [Paenibacillus sambharensis]PZD96716.1 hypothetical protein DNH61_05830 [Paenibacillus sambharensis]